GRTRSSVAKGGIKLPSLFVGADPGAKPSEPFRERLECCEGGNTGRRAIWPCHNRICVAVRSAPGRDRAEAVVIGVSDRNASNCAACGSRLDRRQPGGLESRPVRS